MSEKTIGAHRYSIGKLDARKQFHVARRLTPIMGHIVVAMTEGMKDPAGVLVPMAGALAHMPDADVDFILTTCFGVVQRQIPGDAGWGPVQAPNGALMYDDIDMAQMLQLAWAVVEENLGGFLSALPSALGAAAGAPQA